MKKTHLAYLLSIAMISAPLAAVQAEETDTDITSEDVATLSTGEQKVVEDIATDFEDFAGDDSTILVEQLRNGEDLSYEVETEQVVLDENGDPVLIEATDENGDIIMEPVVNENGDPVLVEATDENGDPIEVGVTDENGDPVLVQSTDENGELLFDDSGEPIMEQQTEIEMVQATEPKLVEQTEIVMETIIVENTNGEMGFGEVSLTLGLAESLLGDGASYSDIADALYGDAGILAMRTDGMGWGEIYQSFDMNVGEVMSGVKSQRFANVETLNRGQAKRLEKVDVANLKHGGKPDKIDRPVRAEKVARPDRPQRPEKAARPERPERPEKVARPERPERPERVARPERPEKPNKPERPGRS